MIQIIKSNDHLQLKNWLKQKIKTLALKETEILNIDWTTNLDLSEFINQNSLFDNFSCFIINDCKFLTKQSLLEKESLLINQLNTLAQDNYCLLITDGNIVKKEILEKNNCNFEIIELKKINDKQKQEIVNEWLQHHQLALSKAVYSRLLTSLDFQYGNIINELKKLKLGIDNRLNEEEQLMLISNYNEDNIFNLLEMILFKKYDKAFHIYQYLINKQEDEIMIINALSAQLFNLYCVISLLKQNVAISKIHELTSLHIYVINLYKTKFINYNIIVLLKIIDAFYELEKDIKLQKIDKKIGLKNLLLKL